MKNPKIKIRIDHDELTENPFEDSGANFYRFDHPSQVMVTDDGDIQYQQNKNYEWTTFDIEQNGESWWWLSCYRHGSEHWSLMGEGYQCRWDTTEKAGIVSMDSETLKSYQGTDITNQKHPTDFLRLMLNDYNAWCQGDCWWFRVELEYEENVEGCCDKCHTPDVNWYETEEVEFDSCGCILHSDHCEALLLETLGTLFDTQPEFKDAEISIKAGSFYASEAELLDKIKQHKMQEV